jgi:glucose/arabinose dehydrogenase
MRRPDAYIPEMRTRPSTTGHLAPAALLVAAIVILAAACQPTFPSIPSQPSPTRQAGPTGPVGPTSPPTTVDYRVEVKPFAQVAGGPLAIAAPHDGSGRLFVASQAGQIWSVDADGRVLPDPMIDLAPFIVSGYEQGLLGLALHPDFPNDPRAFVNYTGENGDTSISSIALDPSNRDRFDVSSLRRLLFIDQPYANHNGGGTLFGPDGFLYLALGDGGSGGDPHGNGQSLDTLLGKILRIDIDAGDRDYGIPADNPFASTDGMDEIWHYGLRNPWRLSFDRATGDLWIGDVGQGAWEEIDVARDGAGGLNFGWNRMEGAHCFGAESCDSAGLVLPVTEYGHDRGCTVIGGYVYRGSASPLLQGAYLFADYCSGTIFAIDGSTAGPVAPAEVGHVDGSVSAFGEDEAGELYLTTLDGNVYRVSTSPA